MHSRSCTFHNNPPGTAKSTDPVAECSHQGLFFRNNSSRAWFRLLQGTLASMRGCQGGSNILHSRKELEGRPSEQEVRGLYPWHQCNNPQKMKEWSSWTSWRSWLGTTREFLGPLCAHAHCLYSYRPPREAIQKVQQKVQPPLSSVQPLPTSWSCATTPYQLELCNHSNVQLVPVLSAIPTSWRHSETPIPCSYRPSSNPQETQR
ncbi:uncharacterized protein LOC125431973 [Sphaerodactylus townsendi]|uniref:uncharacterized protein LOC125431973 n=1 Tax=Sphaerodactylus townsendi TaxID=933632 RepID=UPI00202752FA|nr:uncharacterized protein LOC125431973 [Sphaerodactylus townsendi]